MRLGTPAARSTLAQEAARLFRAIQVRLGELDAVQQLELAGELADPEATWDRLPHWARDVFCKVWREIHEERRSL